MANSYVAACKYDVSTGNEMICINPMHPHANTLSHEFASVWLEATASSCDIKITRDSPKTVIDTSINGNDPRYTAEGAIVYAKDGSYECTKRYLGTGQRYVPDFLPNIYIINSGPCYGAYRFEGTYEDLSANVMS